MKKRMKDRYTGWKRGLACLSAAVLLTGCGTADAGNGSGAEGSGQIQQTGQEDSAKASQEIEGAVNIALSDSKITVDGEAVSQDEKSAVYTANDIVYYESGKDFTYGAGGEEDAHTAEEAAAHTVVHITQPGTYALRGSLSAGQIAVDLGEEAEDNPEAAVTLVLNGVDISCSVAPAVIFYNVYECGEPDEESATKDVDTSAAGANVIIADGTENNVTGSYVARIYKSYELNEAGTEVVSNKKLHKYDGAFYSKMSMNVNGGEKGDGVLNIVAENEGLDSELHLTINGGNISIVAGNDGINTNEDNVSVTTINGGSLYIRVEGSTGEGDGIDSNGWLVINGGSVVALACSTSADSGIDSDLGIHINGGSVAATGNMLDEINESERNYAVFAFAERQKGGETYSIKSETGETVMEVNAENDFTYLIFAGDALAEGSYTLWQGETQLAGAASEGGMAMMGMPGGMPGMAAGERPEMPEGGMAAGERPEMPEGGMAAGAAPEMPEGGMAAGERPEMPEGGMAAGERPEMPEGGMAAGAAPEMPAGAMSQAAGEVSEVFELSAGGNYFRSCSAVAK